MMTHKLFDLNGKVALVTGGSKGLGKAMARGFAEAGADVFISSRHEDQLKAALDDILDGTGRRGGYCVTDMSKRDQVEHLAKEAVRQMGKVDILINNAGTNAPQPIDEITDETWDMLMETNLNSVMVLTRALVPPMRQRKWGRIIHISSIFGVVSKEARNGYSVTKSALIGLSKASALDLGEDGVTVNVIAPGPFLTDLPLSMLTDEQQAQFAKMTALNRWGKPVELVGPALMLASDAGSYITGTTLMVDGGYTAR